MKEDAKELFLFIANGNRACDFKGGIHPNRINFLCDKWADKGLYDYGAFPTRGWLTEKGKALAAELVNEASAKPLGKVVLKIDGKPVAYAVDVTPVDPAQYENVHTLEPVEYQPAKGTIEIVRKS